ncbi:MAG: PspC domain-containing protein, partial [Acidimicrobiia bacterium]
MSTDDTPPGPTGVPGDTPDPGTPPSSVDAPPPPPPPVGRSFRLVRARHDRKLGGVSAGLATAAGLDPTLVRMGMAVGALTGWAVLGYLVAWVVLPEEDEAAGRRLEPAPEDTARLLRIGLAIIAGLGALQVAGIVAGVAFAVLGTVGALFNPFIDPFAGDFGGFNPDFPVRGMTGLILLVAGGAFLLRRRNRKDVPPPGTPFGGSGGGFPPPGSGGNPPPPPPGGTGAAGLPA